MKKLMFLLLLIPQICFAQMIVQNRDIKQPPECKFFISSNIPIIKDIATNKTITINGNTAISTVQIKTGKNSIYFDGDGDYLTLTDSIDWPYGAVKWTVDFWYYTPYPNSTMCLSGQFYNTSSYIYTPLFYDSQYYYDYWPPSGSTGSYTNSPNIANSVWTHVAIISDTNNGTPIKLYINGQGGYTYSGATYPDISSVYYIGYAGCSTYYYGGFIQDFRITKGKALWTSNFTPPRRSGAY